MRSKLIALAAAGVFALGTAGTALADNNATGSIASVQVGSTSVAPAVTATAPATTAATSAPTSVDGSGNNNATSSIGTVQAGGGNTASESAGTVQAGPAATAPQARPEQPAQDRRRAQRPQQLSPPEASFRRTSVPRGRRRRGRAAPRRPRTTRT